MNDGQRITAALFFRHESGTSSEVAQADLITFAVGAKGLLFHEQMGYIPMLEKKRNFYLV